MNVPVAKPRNQTWLQTVLWLVLAALLLSAFLPDARNEVWPRRSLMLAVTGLLAALFFLAPRRLRYELADRELVVKYLLGQTRLPYAGMQAWRTSGRLGLRVGGTGLPAYYTGHYTFGSDDLRTVLAASSNTSNGVIVQAEGKAYFLTPAEPEQFLEALARRGARVRA